MGPWRPEHNELVVIYFNQTENCYDIKPHGYCGDDDHMFIGVATYMMAMVIVYRLNTTKHLRKNKTKGE